MTHDYNTLRKVIVNDHVEKKGNLSYLSWAWAVDYLMRYDPTATWEFPEPKYYGETVMVFCNVTAFGKTMRMHLPVMDNRNNAISNPDARKISDGQMRCLAKCIATFGIGLYIYAGEDLPQDTDPVDVSDYIAALQQANDLTELQTHYLAAMQHAGNDKTAQQEILQVTKKRKTELTAAQNAN